jgi:hypothetical protein
VLRRVRCYFDTGAPLWFRADVIAAERACHYRKQYGERGSLRQGRNEYRSLVELNVGDGSVAIGCIGSESDRCRRSQLIAIDWRDQGRRWCSVGQYCNRGDAGLSGRPCIVDGLGGIGVRAGRVEGSWNRIGRLGRAADERRTLVEVDARDHAILSWPAFFSMSQHGAIALNDVRTDYAL